MNIIRSTFFSFRILLNRHYFAKPPKRSIANIRASQDDPKITLLRSFSSQKYPPHRILNMPALSPTMTQGNIGAWKKKIGDAVAPGDVLVEIETDKATMDFECQEDGYLAKIIIPEGTKEAQIGMPICILVEDKADVDKFADFTATKDKQPKINVEVKAGAKLESAAISTPEETPASNLIPPKTGRIFASPVARLIANKEGIDLSKVQGTGPHGRILKSDVAKPALTSAPAFSSPSSFASSFVDIPLSNVRKVIAQRLGESKQTIPHYYLTVDINMDRIQEFRERLNKNLEGKPRISVNDFIIKACASALKKVPSVNSAWHESFIRQYSYMF